MNSKFSLGFVLLANRFDTRDLRINNNNDNKNSNNNNNNNTDEAVKMSNTLDTFVNHSVSVITADGRVIIGTLKGQYSNLQKCRTYRDICRIQHLGA